LTLKVQTGRIATTGQVAPPPRNNHLALLDRKDKGVPVSESIQKELIEVQDALGLKYRFGLKKQIVWN